MSKRILVIENDVEILDIISYILSEEKFIVERSSELPPFSTLKKIGPDLILLDEYVCRRPCAELCIELKKDALIKEIPVILMSTQKDIEKVAEECHADGFINKPFDVEEMVTLIKNTIKDS